MTRKQIRFVLSVFCITLLTWVISYGEQVSKKDASAKIVSQISELRGDRKKS